MESQDAIDEVIDYIEDQLQMTVGDHWLADNDFLDQAGEFLDFEQDADTNFK